MGYNERQSNFYGRRFMSAEPVAYHTKKTFCYLVRFQCVVCLLLCALNVGLLIPLLVYTSSDVTFESSLLPPLLEVLSALVDIAVYTVAFSSAVFAFRLYPAKKAIWLPLTFFLTALVRRAASLGVEVLTSGSIGSDDIQSAAFYLVVEILLDGAVSLIAFCVFHKTPKKDPSLLYPPFPAPKGKFLPCRQFFDRTAPVQRAALGAGILLAAVKIVSRILYDIMYTVVSGFPNDAGGILREILVMILYYASDILGGALAYLGILFLIRLYYRHILKKLLT